MIDVIESIGPRHIPFYIEFWSRQKSDYEKEIEDCKKDIKDFKILKIKNINEKGLRFSLEKIIKERQQEIKNSQKEIEIFSNAIKNMEKANQGFIEDIKKGLFYDQDTGELINKEPLKEVPENAYIAKGVSYG